MSRGGCWQAEELVSVEGLEGLKYAIDAVQQFAHGCHQGNHLEFALGQQVVVVGSEPGVAADRDQNRHEQGAAQMPISDLADTNFLFHRFSGSVLPRIQAGVRHPLTNIAVRSEQYQFAEQLQCAGFSDPRKT